MDEVSADSGLRVACVPEVLEASMGEIFEDGIVVVAAGEERWLGMAIPTAAIDAILRKLRRSGNSMFIAGRMGCVTRGKGALAEGTCGSLAEAKRISRPVS